MRAHKLYVALTFPSSHKTHLALPSYTALTFCVFFARIGLIRWSTKTAISCNNLHHSRPEHFQPTMNQLLLSYSFIILFHGCFFSFVMTLPYVAKSLQISDINLAYAQTFFNILQLLSTTLMGNILSRLGYRLTLALPFLSVGISSLILVYATVRS